MGEINISVTKKGYKCERCNHKWLPRANEPKSLPVCCPKCCSPYWNTPRKLKQAKSKNGKKSD